MTAVRQVELGVPVEEVCRKYGISQQTEGQAALPFCFYAVLLFRKGCRRQAGHPLPPCTVLVSTLYAFLPSISHSLRVVYELAQSDFW